MGAIADKDGFVAFTQRDSPGQSRNGNAYVTVAACGYDPSKGVGSLLHFGFSAFLRPIGTMRLTLLILALFLAVAAGPPLRAESPTPRAPVSTEHGSCPYPSEDNVYKAEYKIGEFLALAPWAWHRTRLGLEGATMAEVEPVTDAATCAEINRLTPMVRDGVVHYLPYRVRGVVLVVFSKPLSGKGGNSAYPAGEPIAFENVVLW